MPRVSPRAYAGTRSRGRGLDDASTVANARRLWPKRYAPRPATPCRWPSPGSALEGDLAGRGPFGSPEQEGLKSGASIAWVSWPRKRVNPRPRPNSVTMATGSSRPEPAWSFAENAVANTVRGCTSARCQSSSVVRNGIEPARDRVVPDRLDLEGVDRAVAGALAPGAAAELAILGPVLEAAAARVNDHVPPAGAAKLRNASRMDAGHCLIRASAGNVFQSLTIAA